MAADVAKSAGQGLVTGTEGLLGLPGDISRGVRWAANKATYPLDYGMTWAEGWAKQKAGALAPGETPASYASKKVGQGNAIIAGQEPLPSSTQVAQAGRSAGMPDYQPQTTAGRYAETIGSFVPGALLSPETSLPKVAANVAKYAVLPGAASEAAGQLFEGTPFENAARNTAAIATGGLSDLGHGGAYLASRGAAHFVEPFTEAGQKAIAARKLQGQFVDPQAASAELAKAAALQTPGAALGEIVPGSKPTTGQLTGDLGALNFEREIATSDPARFQSNDFGTGASQQNAARTAALQGVQSTGSPEAIGDALRGSLAKINADQDAAVQSAAQTAQRAASVIGSGLPPEELGANMRTALQGPADVAKAHERKLWGAVDPDGTLALPAAPVSNAAASIVKTIPATAKPMSGEEAAIFDTASNLPEVAPFGDVTALRSRISTALREEMRSAGPTPTYARLSQLRGAVEGAIVSAAQHKAAVDHAAVAAGELAPQDALSARIDGLLNESSGSGEPGQGSGRSAASAGAAPSAGAPIEAGAAGQGVGRPGNNSSDQTISRGVAPNLADASLLGPGRVYYPSGSLDVNYELADLGKLVTSHNQGFGVNAAYPADLQPRARQSAPARDQVNSMAASLQPERLGRSPEANSGAPIVGPDNVVESGNGRVLALSKAYQAGRGGDYKHWLSSQGVDAKGLDRPVLVARRQTTLSPADRVAFAHSANTASGLSMSDGEKAFSDAKLISSEAVKQLADSGIDSAENRPFVRSFLSQLSPSERADLMDSEGALSQKGVRRLDAALVAKGYGDGDFIDKAFVTKDANIKGLASGLTDAAPAWIKMRDAARDGTIDSEHDVTPALMNAVRGVVRARLAGRPVSEVLNQGDMFGGEASALAKGLIVGKNGTLASREQIAENLRNYANEAQKNLAGPSLFGDTVSPSQVLRASLAKSGAGAGVAEPEIASAAMRPGPVANLDAAAAERLKAATAATRNQRATFGNGPVGQALKRAGNATDYRMTDAALPGDFFKPGPKGAEQVEAFRDAAGYGGPPNMNPIHDAAAESLRREAMTPEGMIDPKDFARWQDKYQDALRALPADLRDQFSSAARASEAVGEAAAARKAAIDSFQKSEVGKIAGLSSAHDLVSHVGRIVEAPDGVRRMVQLRQAVAKNPEAVEGLRKGVVDYLLSKTVGTTESGVSGLNSLKSSVLQKAVIDNRAIIKAAGFSDREIGSMQAIANDMQRSQRTLQATRLPGQSNTAQDILKSIQAAEHGPKLSLLGKIGAGAYLGMEHGLYGAAAGAASGLGEHLIAGMRAAGVAKANALVRDAMLNPELAQDLLKAAPLRPDGGIERVVARMLLRYSLYPSTNAARRYPPTATAAFAKGGFVSGGGGLLDAGTFGAGGFGAGSGWGDSAKAFAYP